MCDRPAAPVCRRYRSFSWRPLLSSLSVGGQGFRLSNMASMRALISAVLYAGAPPFRLSNTSEAVPTISSSRIRAVASTRNDGPSARPTAGRAATPPMPHQGGGKAGSSSPLPLSDDRPGLLLTLTLRRPAFGEGQRRLLQSFSARLVGHRCSFSQILLRSPPTIRQKK